MKRKGIGCGAWVAIGVVLFVAVSMCNSLMRPVTYQSSGPAPGVTLPPYESPTFSAPPPAPWWRGGTLHGASPATWAAASRENKMATAADWLASLALARGLDLHPDELRSPAADVVECVDEAVRPPAPPLSDVRDAALFCILTMTSTRRFAG